ncbi:hypothetical protein FQN54_007794 [Arachnomyces sp. PD_36]|nr:hypothetical protein FQN54_007794 [Arachnomyces sp. PD_36]
MAAARLIDKRPHNIPGRLKVAELSFDVPLDYNNPNAARIRIFARSVRRLTKPVEPETGEKQLPWLVYLQGGPGMSCRPPQEYAWIAPVLDRGYQILFLDQRGTGLSTPITAGTLARQGDAVKQAEYLRLFRADSIVQDCEAIRKCLTADFPEEKKKWSTLGQSFGGFCSVTYLSKFPEGLKEVFTCGGLPPLVNGPDPVYTAIYEKVAERNEVYYAKFPEDTERVKRILAYLKKEAPVLPSGDVLIPARFQQMGIFFGMGGGLDLVHDIVLRSISDLDNFGFLTRPTLFNIESAGGFENNVIYAILHEPLYCQGTASNWSADRLLSNDPRFRLDSDQVFFTGEMIYKNMFESYGELKAMEEPAQILASYDDWPALYDEEQLAKNEVPVYSATYVEDMYVNFKFATDTASKIKNCKQFITNTMYHDGIRARADEVMRQLFTLRDDSID